MRKMKLSRILVFFTLMLIVVVFATGLTAFSLGLLPLGDFRGVAMFVGWVFFFYVFSILIFRLFQVFCPLPLGEVIEDSRDEFVYHVYLLFYLLVFNPIMFSGLVPIPLMRLFYQALGTRMGANTFSVGIILDPQFVTLGSNTIIGNGALLIPHILEGTRLAHHPIIIGNNVTVGARSVILCDVAIGDGATVAVGAVVTKGCRIGAGETWAGMPAHRIDNVKSEGAQI
ncbi:putative glycan acetyltransferase [Nitrosococcus halophilus Nc 4]|uniref:Glycan acetyltransferase n=1 Tax=Nitrosococcus halophilus (strain Nc4) TaxID=472759 RepID=D5C051_NITHN|nr:glycan acetyltransferase [Nitrosococcus halophilus]ADE16298.1 putative glycan acetyltransferase [Nitrosococcus halophilus Nc 4]